MVSELKNTSYLAGSWWPTWACKDAFYTYIIIIIYHIISIYIYIYIYICIYFFLLAASYISPFVTICSSWIAFTSSFATASKGGQFSNKKHGAMAKQGPGNAPGWIKFGWWFFATPLKNMSQLGLLFPTKWKVIQNSMVPVTTNQYLNRVTADWIEYGLNKSTSLTCEHHNNESWLDWNRLNMSLTWCSIGSNLATWPRSHAAPPKWRPGGLWNGKKMQSSDWSITIKVSV